MTVYYAIAQYLEDGGHAPLTSQEVEHFEGLRQSVKGKDDDQLTSVEVQVVDFARYSQGTTSGSYLSARMRIFLSVERGLDVA